MRKLNNKHGITMAEILLVLGILAVLAAVGIIMVSRYRRSLGQLERDGIAKEIFIAAQNHLTLAYGEGYLGLSEAAAFGVEDTVSVDENGADVKGDYYFVVNGSVPEGTVLAQMLPFGAIDETVRLGGSYIIRYQKDTGLVLDVFYCTRSGSPDTYNRTLIGSEDYADALAARDTEAVSHKDLRRDWKEGSILGWYGGAEAAKLPTLELDPPELRVCNEEKLYAELTDTNAGKEAARLMLLVTGVDSGARKAYDLKTASDGDETKHMIIHVNDYTVVLDDVTTADWQFGKLLADNALSFIPGEDLEIQAVAYSTDALAKPAYSPKYTTNSLFAAVSETGDTAYIANFRHLENLDAAISNLNAGQLGLQYAEQTDSFSWLDFRRAVREIESKSALGTRSPAGYETVQVFRWDDTASQAGCYLPIQPSYTLSYDGQSHSISDVVVRGEPLAGLFGGVTRVRAVHNLELLDFDVRGTEYAGTLAGTMQGCTVTNVLARDTAAGTSATVVAPVAGGLIGSAFDGASRSGAVRYCGAAVIVRGTTGYAGGLIGDAATEVTGCYAGGHTESGAYGPWVEAHCYDVTGSTAGGLLGRTSAAVRDSYSTCSVSGSYLAGGFAGELTGGSIQNCYATGLLNQSGGGLSAPMAFLADGSTSALSGNYYYREINQITQVNEETPMLPYGGYTLNSYHNGAVQALDLNAEAYNRFTGSYEDWKPARAYDPALVTYYNGRYNLRTVPELNDALPTGYSDWTSLFVSTHYGDWPSPEVFFINPS